MSSIGKMPAAKASRAEHHQAPLLWDPVGRTQLRNIEEGHMNSDHRDSLSVYFHRNLSDLVYRYSLAGSSLSPQVSVSFAG